MPQEKRLLVDVGMRNLPFPMKVASKQEPDGQATVGTVSVSARITSEFEADWIDTFIRVFHQHRDNIGTKFLRHNIVDYFKELNATSARVTFDYPFFIEKTTPVSKEKCLVKYQCSYTAKISPLQEDPKITFRIEIPVITTDPASVPGQEGGLYGQLSMVLVEVASQKDIYPEDLVEIADKHALSPVYSFLDREDQIHIVKKVHTQKKSSVVMTDEIKDELARNDNIEWFMVHCTNFGMLHSYSTIVGTEKSMWVPLSGYEDDEV